MVRKYCPSLCLTQSQGVTRSSVGLRGRMQVSFHQNRMRDQRSFSSSVELFQKASSSLSNRR